MSVKFTNGWSVGSVSLSPKKPLIKLTQDTTATNGSNLVHGDSETFSVTATVDYNAILTYQWQRLSPGGSWTNISGATSSSYTTPSLSYSTDNGAQYRCILTATYNASSVTTTSRTLAIKIAYITINTQPSNTSADAGSTATFSVSASANLSATLSYQWQRQDYSGAGSWGNIGGATSSSYTTPTLTVTDDNGDNYRVYITANKGANAVYSNVASLTVNAISDSFLMIGDGTYYVASDGTQSFYNTGVSAGTVNSEYIASILYGNFDVGTKTVIELKDGTYANMSVYLGAIGTDNSGDRRTFTVGLGRSSGTNYVFQYDGADTYYLNGSNSLTSFLGDNLGGPIYVWYDPDQQSTYTLNTMESAYVGYNGADYYGANRVSSDSSQTYGYLPLFGFLNVYNDYIRRIYYTGGATQKTTITMEPGYYDFGGGSTLTVEANCAIGGDTTGSTRYFKVNNSQQTFTYNSTSQNYTATGDVFNLTGSAGQSPLSVEYDPANQPAQGGGGGGGGGSVGEIAVVSGGWGGGGGPSQLFLIIPNTETAAISALTALQSGQVMTIKQGSSTTSVTMSSAFMVFAAGPNNTGFQAPTAESNQYYAQGFDQLTSVVIGTGTATYVAGTDYNPGGPPNYGPPGLSVGGMMGGPYNLTIFTDGWTNTSGRDAILAKTSGTTFTAIIGGTTLNGTITSGWSSFGPGSYASVTLDGTPMGSTTSITI